MTEVLEVVPKLGRCSRLAAPRRFTATATQPVVTNTAICLIQAFAEWVALRVYAMALTK